jgi:hypothetical protein
MTIEQKLQAIIDRFVGEITDLVREAALESVQSALSGDEPKRVAAKATRRKASSAPRKVAAPKSAAKKGKRVRRTAADLRKTADAILAYVKSNDGCAMSDLTKKFGETAIKLRPAVQILMGEGAIHTTGAKRGTKYHAGRGGAKRKASGTKAKRKPATRKKAARKTKRR